MYHSFWLLLFVCFVGIASNPFLSLAHVEPEEGEKAYITTLELTGVTLAEDDNVLGPAKVLFDSVVTPTDPKHDESRDITIYPVAVEEGESVPFAPKTLYSHEQCGCEQDLDLSVTLLDHSPALSALGRIARGGLKAGSGFLVGGLTGVGVNLVGQLVDVVVDGITRMNLSPKEKEELKQAELRAESEALGIVQESPDTSCNPATQEFTAPIMLGGTGNGTLSYRVTKRETGRACTDEPVFDGSLPDDEEDKPWCEEATGKVFVEGAYHCPPNALPAGPNCVCKEGYEWVYENNHCEGCQKTKSDDCLEAVKKIIDANTGNLSPRLSFEGDNLIKWEEGPLSCKAQGAVLSDWARAFGKETLKYREKCTNLEFVRGDPTGGSSCSLKFFWKYK